MVSHFARRGHCLRGALSRISWVKIGNDIGIGHGFGMFAPFGDGAFLGGVCPQVPLHLRRGGHLGLFKVWPLRGRLAPSYLRRRLAPSYLRRRLAPSYLRRRLAPSYLRRRLALSYLRSGLAYGCRASCQTWLKSYIHHSYFLLPPYHDPLMRVAIVRSRISASWTSDQFLR
jgi:hypothetical protein